MTERKPSIKVNMALNVLLTLSSIVFPLISMPYVTRALGPGSIGRVYFATSVIAMFSMFAELGIPVYGIRACARVRDDRAALTVTAHEILIINLASCTAVYIVFALSLALVPKLAQDRGMLVIMSSGMLLNALGAEWLYKALEKYSYITFRTIAFKAVALAAMIALVRQKDDYVIYGCLTIFAAAASNLLNLCCMRRCIDMRPRGGYSPLRHLRPMLIIFMLQVATAVYTNMDVLFLGILKGDAEAGLYGVSVRLKLGMVNLVTAVSAVLLPRMSYYLDRGRVSDAGRLIDRTLTAVCAVSLPAVSCIMMLAPECIALLAGSEFAGAALPMRIIMPAVVFIAVSNITGMQKLIPMGCEANVTRAAWTGAAADIVLNLLLIPRFASAGAAAATLVTEIIVMAYIVRSLQRVEGRSVFAGVPVTAFAASALLAMPACMPAKLLDAAVPVRIIASGCCYMAVYMILLMLIWRRNGLLRRD